MAYRLRSLYERWTEAEKRLSGSSNETLKKLRLLEYNNVMMRKQNKT